MGKESGIFRDTDASMPEAESKKRLSSIPASLDVGAQTINSNEWFRVTTLKVPSDLMSPGIATAAIVRPSAELRKTPAKSWDEATAPQVTPEYPFNASPNPIGLAPGGKDLEVQFSPTSLGLSRAELHVQARWEDGVEEVHRVELRGTGRAAGDALLDGNGFGEPARVQPPALPEDGGAKTAASDSAALAALSDAAKSARASSTAFTQSRRDGLEQIAKPAAYSFNKGEVPVGNGWEKFAETALSLGISGLMGGFGKQLSARLLSKLFLRKVDKSEPWATGVADFAKEGLKSATKAVLGLASAPGRESKPRQANEEQLIKFFAHQATLLTKIDLEQTMMINAQEAMLRTHLFSDAFVAADTMNALNETFAAMSPTAMSEQASAAELEWVEGVFKASQREADPTIGDDRAFTTFDDLPKLNGLLTVDVTMTAPFERHHSLDREKVKVVGAHMFGVSQLIADRMSAMTLRDKPLPVDIVVTGSGTDLHLRRDETGRVSRVATKPSDPVGFGDRFEMELFDIVLGAPLAAHGVNQIKTDDSKK